LRLGDHPYLALVGALLLFALVPKKALFCVACLGTLLFSSLVYQAPCGPFEGSVRIHPLSLRKSRSLFSSGWLLKARAEAPGVRHFPVVLFVSKEAELPLLDRDYMLEAKIDPEGRLRWEGPWRPIEGSRCFEELRVRIKRWIRAHRKDPLATDLLLGEGTGELDFGRLGLSHIMAVSGFHFSLLAFALLFALRLILPRFAASVLVALFLTLYLWLIGAGPAGQRAYVMALFALLAPHVGRACSSLNAFGAALLFVVLRDPSAIAQLGFQLSFAVTGSILLFYAPIKRRLERLFPRRQLAQSVGNPPLLVAAVSFLRSSLALMASVHLAALPLTLMHFHRFAALSLLYNLVVPPMVALILLMTLVGLPTQWLSALLLDMVHYVPNGLNPVLRCDGFPPALVLLLFVVFIVLKRGLPIVQVWTMCTATTGRYARRGAAFIRSLSSATDRS